MFLPALFPASAFRLMANPVVSTKALQPRVKKFVAVVLKEEKYGYKYGNIYFQSQAMQQLFSGGSTIGKEKNLSQKTKKVFN